MHQYITLAQVQTHSQASGHTFCSVKGGAVKSITCLKLSVSCQDVQRVKVTLLRKLNHGVSSLELQECARCESR